MKKAMNIVKWVISILIILIGVLFLVAYPASGILCILAGVIVLPPISSKIPQFRGKRPVLIVGCIALLFIGILIMPGAESTGEAKTENAVNSNPTTDAETAEELRAWIESSISGTGTVTASDKEIKKWGKLSEESFLTVWQDVVLEQVRQKEQSIDQNDITSGTEQFKDVTNYIKGAVTLYKNAYGDSGAVDEISQLRSDISECMNANKNLKGQYPFNLMTAYISYETFYIAQRLETSYSDNILGVLQKEYDSYQPQSTSDWVAYDVEYSYGVALPGDTYQVIHADSLNPFTQSGVYNIYCVDTGTTKELVDTKGFRNTVTVYQLVENMDDVSSAQQMYWENWYSCMDDLRAIKIALGETEDTETQPDFEGEQTEAYTSSDVCYKDVVIDRMLGWSSGQINDTFSKMGYGEPTDGTSITGELLYGATEYCAYDGIEFLFDDTGATTMIYVAPDYAEVNGTTLDKTLGEITAILGSADEQEWIEGDIGEDGFWVVTYNLHDDVYELDYEMELVFPDEFSVPNSISIFS
jgi:hypothetical protein